MKKQLKQTLSLLMSLVMIISMFTGLEISSFAEDDILSYLTYEINDGEVTITDCDTSISGDVVIPDTIEGYPVTEIGESAFSSCDKITSVIFSNNIISISDYAFAEIDKLKTVRIPFSVLSIGKSAFMGCEKLTEIIVDSNNPKYSVDEFGVLFNKDKTILIQYPAGLSKTNYKIPYGVVKIDNSAFHSNTFIVNIEIPTSVKEIGFAAFMYCRNLSHVVIPNKVTSIESYTFYGCNNLKSIYIPSEVLTIKDDALGNKNYYIVGLKNSTAEHFSKNKGIPFFNADDMPPYFSFEIIDEKITITDCNTMISGDIVIPDEIGGYPVTEIGVTAFLDCTNIDTITIGNNVTTIREYAFRNCNKLKSISISSSVTSIWEESLLVIENVEKFIVDKENKNYCNDENGVLFNKEKTRLIQYPAGNKNEKYLIPDSVEKIGYFSFSGASYLKEVYVPAKVSDLSDNHAFTTIKNLEKIIVDKNNKTYESDEEGVLFYKGKKTLIQYPVGKKQTEYIIPQDVTFVSANAFYNCENLRTITIPHINSQFFSNLSIGFIKGGNTLKKIDGFVIKGFKNSLAEKYANDHGFQFVAIEKYPAEYEELTTEEPTTQEPTTEKPGENNELEVKDEGGIVTDAENKLSYIGTGETADTITAMIENDYFTVVDKNGDKLAGNSPVGTGSSIRVLDKDGNTLNEYTVIVPTDIDGNGKTTAADARLALRASAKIDTIDGIYAVAADANNDKKITAMDARTILRKAAGLE